MSNNSSNSILKRLIFFIVSCSITGNIIAQRQEREANLKAVFIYNFTKYIEWDTTNADNIFTIGIIGSSPITESLLDIARMNTVDNKKIVIRHFTKPEEISYCNILFIPRKIPFSLESILDKVVRGMLTISEEDGYAKMGTAFNFVVNNDKLKFEANLRTISAEGLKASSQLLKLAKIVD